MVARAFGNAYAIVLDRQQEMVRIGRGPERYLRLSPRNLLRETDRIKQQMVNDLADEITLAKKAG